MLDRYQRITDRGRFRLGIHNRRLRLHLQCLSDLTLPRVVGVSGTIRGVDRTVLRLDLRPILAHERTQGHVQTTTSLLQGYEIPRRSRCRPRLLRRNSPHTVSFRPRA